MIVNYFLDPTLDELLPKSAWLDLVKRGKGPNEGYNKCYAKKQADINTFHVLSPWDLHFKFAIDTNGHKGMYAFDEYTKNLIKAAAISCPDVPTFYLLHKEDMFPGDASFLLLTQTL